VRVAVQPSGATPIWLLSKLIAWFDMSFTPRRTRKVTAIMALWRFGWDIAPTPLRSRILVCINRETRF
jgi:hypothetical protein